MNFFLVYFVLVLVCIAHVVTPQTSSPTPAPAPEHVNLTELLSVAGPFHTFLGLLSSTKVIDTFQNQANTDEGITIFVPKDEAFSSLRKQTSLANLTQDQLRSLCLFHALPHYYTLADFRNLSQQNPIPTFAGGQYALNFTDHSGTVRLNSGWTKTKVISAVRATDPVAIYETDRVLLPEAIFGTEIPPTPAPAPAPAPASGTAGSPGAADAPAADRASTTTASAPSSSHRIVVSLVILKLSILGGFMFLFW